MASGMAGNFYAGPWSRTHGIAYEVFLVSIHYEATRMFEESLKSSPRQLSSVRALLMDVIYLKIDRKPLRIYSEKYGVVVARESIYSNVWTHFNFFLGLYWELPLLFFAPRNGTCISNSVPFSYKHTFLHFGRWRVNGCRWSITIYCGRQFACDKDDESWQICLLLGYKPPLKGNTPSLDGAFHPSGMGGFIFFQGFH